MIVLTHTHTHLDRHNRHRIIGSAPSSSLANTHNTPLLANCIRHRSSHRALPHNNAKSTIQRSQWPPRPPRHPRTLTAEPQLVGRTDGQQLLLLVGQLLGRLLLVVGHVAVCCCLLLLGLRGGSGLPVVSGGGLHCRSARYSICRGMHGRRLAPYGVVLLSLAHTETPAHAHARGIYANIHKHTLYGRTRSDRARARARERGWETRRNMAHSLT